MKTQSAPALPWSKFWHNTFTASTEHLDDASFRAYYRLFFGYWNRHGLPANMPQLQRLAQLGTDPDGVVRPIVDEFFTEENGQLRHEHLDVVLKECLASAEVNQERTAKARAAKANKNSVTEPVTDLSTALEERREKREERGEKTEEQKTEDRGEKRDERRESGPQSLPARIEIAEQRFATASPEESLDRRRELFKLKQEEFRQNNHAA